VFKNTSVIIMAMLEAESAAVAQIDAFKNPKEGWFEKLGELADQPLDLAGGAAFESVLGDKFENVVAKAVNSLNDLASWSVREQAIFDEFEALGRTGRVRMARAHGELLADRGRLSLRVAVTKAC
jgi:hypothetical protein